MQSRELSSRGRPSFVSRLFAFSCVLAVIATAGAAVAAAPPQIPGAWRDRDVRIDGNNDEWQGRTTYLEESHLSVGLMNDADYLYVAVSTSEPGRRLQLMAGLTLWIDATGRQKTTFGILLPGAGGLGNGMFRPGARQGRADPGDRQNRPDPEAALERLNEPPTFFELLGPRKKDRRRLELAANPGIEIGRGVHQGTLTLEFKIPLATSAGQYAIGSVAGRTVGIGLETPKREATAMEGRRGGIGGSGAGIGGGGRGGGIGGGGGRGGGMGGRGGGMSGGRGGDGMAGQGGRGGMQMPNPLKLWAVSRLVSQGT
jgi:hypothetical protein